MVGIATCRHDGRAYLAKTYSVAPSATSEADLRPYIVMRHYFAVIGHIFDLKGRTLQMGF